jgi:hypothetical protein
MREEEEERLTAIALSQVVLTAARFPEIRHGRQFGEQRPACSIQHMIISFPLYCIHLARRSGRPKHSPAYHRLLSASTAA